MSRSSRMFEIIHLLRAADGPLTAEAMAGTLEVTKRTVYRDIAALQAMRVPIDGEAGVGYVMRPGFDLPPLMFTAEEVEAIVVGLALLGRTGDGGLVAAAERAGHKISEVLPGDMGRDLNAWPLYASTWTAIAQSRVDPGLLRSAIRSQEKLLLTYEDGVGKRTDRIVKPLAILYYIEAAVLAAWCELRQDFRHFRIDRILAYTATGERFQGEGEKLRSSWRVQLQ